VVFYHAGLGLPGGYVGVDVFFVISGYLITGLILKDLERGTFSLAIFWERRIRRIFPALAVMVSVTMVVGWILLLPDDLAKLGASVIAQSLMVSNFYFWRTTNYFGGANEEKPLLHTWSLAVEEQFYLIFPVGLMAIWSFFNYRLKKTGTTNYTNRHEKGEEEFTTEDTESTEGHTGLRPGSRAGASESDLLANKLAVSPVSESPNSSADGPASALDSGHWALDSAPEALARDSENTSLTRSASIPASVLRAGQREMGSAEGNQLDDSEVFLRGQSQTGLQMEFQKTSNIRFANALDTSGRSSSSVLISDISGKSSGALDAGRPPLDSASPTLATSYSPLDTSTPVEHRRWALFWIFAAVSLVSLGISIWGVKAQPFATFFLLPTRAWELLLGSMLAVLPGTVVIRSAHLRELLSMVGLAGILGPVFFYGEQTPFPGLAALLPCLGTAMLIWANAPTSEANSQGWIARWLAWRPMVFIGLISYSLYLWHWPVICFTSYWAVSDFTLFEKLGLVALSIILALISWKFIERPFRKKLKILTRPRIFTLAGVSTAIVLAGGLAFQLNGGFPSRLPDSVVSVLENLRQDEARRHKFAFLAPNIIDYSQDHLNSLPRIGAQDPRIPISFAVLGDSHAQVSMAMFDELAKKHQKSGVAITHQGTPPLLGWNITQSGGAKNPAALWNAAFEFIQTKNIRDVFLIGYWPSYDHQETTRLSIETITKFSNAGINSWLLHGAPVYKYNVARMYLKNMYFNRIFQFQETFTPRDEYLQTHKTIFQSLYKKFPNRVIDCSLIFLNHKDGKFRVTLNNQLLYFDSNHLTLAGNQAAYLSSLETTFSQNSDSLKQ